MDTSKRTLDYIIGRFSDPGELGREEYGEMFKYVSNLIYPFLSNLGMKPLDESKSVMNRKVGVALKNAGLQDVRLLLAKESHDAPRRPMHSNFGWGVYLTEKGHWVIVALWRKEGEDVSIIQTKEDFLEYYDGIQSPGTSPVHPSHWLFSAPSFIVDRAATKIKARGAVLDQLHTALLQSAMRFEMVEMSTPES